MICSTLLPLTPKSLPPFGGQTQITPEILRKLVEGLR